jgi:hypothetical protein
VPDEKLRAQMRNNLSRLGKGFNIMIREEQM